MLDNYAPIFKAIYAGVRPARVITLVNEQDKDWVDTCFRVIEWYSQMWGGNYNLIVPTNGDVIREEFWHIAEMFDPDYIFTYEKTMLDFKLSAPHEYSEWLKRQVDSFVRENPGSDRESTEREIDGRIIRHHKTDRFGISEALKKEIACRLNHFNADGTVHSIRAQDGVPYPLTALTSILPNSTVSSVFDLEVDSSKIIQLIIYSVSGLLSSFKINLSKQIEENTRHIGGLRILAAELNELNAIKEHIEQPKYSGDEVKNLLRFVWSGGKETAGVGDLFQFTPFSTAMVGLEFYYRGYPEVWKAPVILVTGDTINDFCLFYALDRLRGQVCWIPSEILESHKKAVNEGKPHHGGDLLFSLLSGIVEQIDYGYSEKRIVLTSLSKLRDVLDTIIAEFEESYPIPLGMATEEKKAAPIKEFIQVSTEIQELLPYVKQVFERNNFPTYYGTEQFINGESLNYFNSPRPKGFTKINPNGHYWIAEFNIEGYKLPAKAELSRMVVKHKTYSNREIRVAKYGVDYHCPNIAYFGGDIDTTLVRPKLGLPNAFEVFKTVFGEAGYEINTSDKGNFQSLSISKFGSLEDLAKAFLDTKCRQLLDKFIDETPNKQGVYDEGVFFKGEPRYLDLVSMEKAIGRENDGRELLAALLGKEVLHRGFIFKCGRCKNADWYSIGEVKDSFKCRRCGLEQVYGSNHLVIQENAKRLEPMWYYRLDEVVYQGYRNDMIVPVLALYALQKTTKESFLFVPELDVWQKKTNSSHPYLEIDVCCIVDGQIVIGECKKGEELESTASKEESKLARYKYVAEKVGASRVIFATICDCWTPATTNRIGRAFETSRVCSELLSKDDLLS